MQLLHVVVAAPCCSFWSQLQLLAVPAPESTHPVMGSSLVFRFTLNVRGCVQDGREDEAASLFAKADWHPLAIQAGMDMVTLQVSRGQVDQAAELLTEIATRLRAIDNEEYDDDDDDDDGDGDDDNDDDDETHEGDNTESDGTCTISDGKSACPVPPTRTVMSRAWYNLAAALGTTPAGTIEQAYKVLLGEVCEQLLSPAILSSRPPGPQAWLARRTGRGQLRMGGL